jgi:hypothetical protein
MKGVAAMQQSPHMVLPLLLWRRGQGRGGRFAHLPRWLVRAPGRALSCFFGRRFSLRTASSPWPSPPKEERETAPRRGRARCPQRAAQGRGRLGVWILLSGQPEGLPEGSRRSPGVSWGRRPPGNRVEEARHPGRGARVVARRGSVWHPSGVRETKNMPSGGRSPPCPERPPATICQPSGLASTNEAGRECPHSPGALGERALPAET